MFSGEIYALSNEKKINQLYEYLSKQRGYKHFSWFSGGLHGLNIGDENYTLIFSSKKELGVLIDLNIHDNKGYLSFTDGFYRLDTQGFNVKEFIKFIK